VQAIDNALSKVSELRGVNYKWKDAQRGEGLQMGLIAQEVEKVLPELVSTDSNGDKSITYSNLTALLIEAVKELSEKLAKLESAAPAV
jgi:Chaperone of endosialidase